jgi:hypothetical protein
VGLGPPATRHTDFIPSAMAGLKTNHIYRDLDSRKHRQCRRCCCSPIYWEFHDPVFVGQCIYISSRRNAYVLVASSISCAICLPSTPLKSLGAIVLVRVVLVSTVVVDVLLIIHALSVLFCLTLRLLAVEPVLALCFRETIDFSTCIVIQ